MSDPVTSSLSIRKQPKQARSEDLVQTILQAAVQVLRRDGIHAFTTARVAERAGVSVGSLYQYFPNKASILFRLQTDEWQQTMGLLQRTLFDQTMPPLVRVRTVVEQFFQSECEEVVFRTALDDAASFYRDAPEAMRAKEAQEEMVLAFLAEALPDCPSAQRRRAGLVLQTTLSALGKMVSEGQSDPAEVAAMANETAEMLCAYLRHLGATE